jgi:short-subunit dehydrogenase
MKPSVETILILGGTSAVAMAYARMAALKGHRIHLVGRRKNVLEANSKDLIGRGASEVDTTVADLGKPLEVDSIWKNLVKTEAQIDRVLIAYGVLGDQQETTSNLSALETNLNTNFVSAALWAETAFAYFKKQGSGQITVIGSVAGDRGRQSNYHYGAAKGGLDVFVSGLAHKAAKTRESRIGVLLVKPGFIDTPMTDGLDKGGPLWATPEKVAKIIHRAETKGKTKIYAPWFWRFILLIIRFVPFSIFKRSSL